MIDLYSLIPRSRHDPNLTRTLKSSCQFFTRFANTKRIQHEISEFGLTFIILYSCLDTTQTLHENTNYHPYFLTIFPISILL
jgi:hypothetical protein